MSLLHYSLGPGVDAFTTRRESVLPYPVIQGAQVHGSNIAVIERPDTTRDELQGYDAFITHLPGVSIGVRTADCVPILLSDPRNRVIAAIHSGWKGTVQKIALKTIRMMETKFKTNPGDLVAVIGPSIGPLSFQVGEEVATMFKESGFRALTPTSTLPSSLPDEKGSSAEGTSTRSGWSNQPEKPISTRVWLIIILYLGQIDEKFTVLARKSVVFLHTILE